MILIVIFKRPCFSILQLPTWNKKACFFAKVFEPPRLWNSTILENLYEKNCKSQVFWQKVCKWNAYFLFYFQQLTVVKLVLVYFFETWNMKINQVAKNFDFFLKP